MGKATLSKRQLSELKKVFMQFDKDNDGTIAEVELRALLRSFGLKPDQQQLTTLIHKADQNNNGLVEFSEFISLIRPNIEFEEEVYNQEQLHALFHKFDRDGNGYITAVELAHSMARLGHMLSVRELTEMMREADIDGDGRISFDEFVLARLMHHPFGDISH